MTIPAGQTSVSVPITIVNTALWSEPENVVITAAAAGYYSATGTVQVQDGTDTLGVGLPASAPENGGTVTGTVTASVAPAQNLSLQLTSSGTTHLTVPATVTIPAGQTSANFTATLDGRPRDRVEPNARHRHRAVGKLHQRHGNDRRPG